jgi:hypothetical protein
VLEAAGLSAREAGSLQALGAIVQLAPAFAVRVPAARSRNQIGQGAPASSSALGVRAPASVWQQPRQHPDRPFRPFRPDSARSGRIGRIGRI